MSAPARPSAGRTRSAGYDVAAGRFRVGVIGAGRVGAVLGAALVRAGHRVVAVTRGSPDSRERVRRLIPAARVRPVDRVPRGMDLVLLAVPDDVLPGLVIGLAAAGAVAPGQVVAHTSGAYGIDVLQPLTDQGARPLALHPAMTFTGHADDLNRLAEGISFGVTAPAPLRPFATRLVADLGGAPEWVDEADRPLYHAALAHGANHLVTLVNEALDRLREAGVAQPERVLAPLLRAALENTLRHGDRALTGPVSRGDAGTVAKHLAQLRRTAPDAVPAYVALARRTADRAIASGQLRVGDAGPLLGVLAGDPPVPAGRPGRRREVAS